MTVDAQRRSTILRVVLRVVIPSLAVSIALYVTGHAERGGWQFYVATFVAAAIYFIAWLRGPDPLRVVRSAHPARDLARGAVLGVGLFALFVGGAFLVRDIPMFSAPVHGLLDNARVGILPLTIATTLINGVGEELFFRDEVMRALPGSWRVRAGVSLLLYIAVTAAMGVPLLAVAAVAIGVASTSESRRTGALISPMVLHGVWALGLLLVLPRLI